MSKKLEFRLSEEARQQLGDFSGVESKIKHLRETANEKRNEIRGIEKEMENLSEINEAISGLGRRDEDPGKNRTAYYFVSELEEDNMVKSDVPTQTTPCRYCTGTHPVLMSYVQAYDSPEGDTWVKEAFYICPLSLKIDRIKSTSRSHRF